MIKKKRKKKVKKPILPRVEDNFVGFDFDLAMGLGKRLVNGSIKKKRSPNYEARKETIISSSNSKVY